MRGRAETLVGQAHGLLTKSLPGQVAIVAVHLPEPSKHSGH